MGFTLVGACRAPPSLAQPGASGKATEVGGLGTELLAEWVVGPRPLRSREEPPALTQPLTEAAVCPQEARGTVAVPRGRVTGAPVETSTQLLTTRPKAPGGAPCRGRGQLPGAGRGLSLPQCRAWHTPTLNEGRPEGGPTGGPGSTHVAGSRCRGSQEHTHRPPRQGGRPGSRWDTGTSAHSCPQRCRVGRLGCRQRQGGSYGPGPVLTGWLCPLEGWW